MIKIVFSLRNVSLGVAATLLLSELAMAGNAFVTYYPAAAEREDRTTLFKDLGEGEAIDDKFMWFSFADTPTFGDAAIVPFGDGIEYKLNAVNYNLYLGEEVRVPFQLYLGDFASNENPEVANENVLLDPTQGIAVQFPIAWLFNGVRKDGFCNFSALKGYCMLGGDVTLRGLQLNEMAGENSVEESFVFGASASLRASFLFPIHEIGGADGNQDGHLGLSFGVRYYYHNSEDEQLLFGGITDPDDNPIEFDETFSAFSAEAEFNIYQQFRLRFEYFSPLSNDDALGDVFKAGFVIATK